MSSQLAPEIVYRKLQLVMSASIQGTQGRPRLPPGPSAGGARTKSTGPHRRDKRKGTPEPEVARRPQQRAPVGSHMGGRRILSGGSDGTVKVWPGPAARRDELCATLTQSMSRPQWRDWVSPDIDYIKVCPDLPVAPD
jgi:hypothetical protein